MKRLHLLVSVAILALVAAGCVSVELQSPGGRKAENEQGAVKVSLTRSAEWRHGKVVDFQAGTHLKTKVLEVGDGAITLVDNAQEGTFTSPAKQTDFPFNAVGVVQTSRIPKGASIEIEIRTSQNGRDWSNWIPVHAQAPTKGEKDDAESQILAVKTGRFLQYRALLSSVSSAPVLEDVVVTYIDSTQGPTMEEAKKVVLPKGPGQPTIISREGWGANKKYRYDAEGKEIWPAEFRQPEKIVIHHTLTPNEGSDFAAMVRAVYYYHAVTLGWGDIGYNYLVDAAGNIYEGRRGDGVVAGHAYGHNYGSIGIAVLGDYENTDVSDAARKSLVELLAWLSDKYGIDPRGHSFFVDRDLPNIFGHKDSNRTSCPGKYLYARIPDLRKVTFDKLPPSTVKIESPTDGGYVSGPQIVKLVQEDRWSLTKVDYFVDDKPVASLSGSDLTWRLDPSKYSQGQHTLKVVVTNALGKQSSATQKFVVRRQPASTWYFAEGSTSPGFETWLLLMNPNLVPANAVITVFDEAGKTDRRDLKVGPKSRLNVFINDIAPDKAVGFKVEADQTIYAERAIYFGHDGHTSVGTANLSKTWYFAEGSTESYFNTWLLVLNPNDGPAKLNITYYKPDGTTVRKLHSLGATSRMNISVARDLPGTALAMKVDSDVPVVAERSVYFDGGHGGHNTVGAVAPSQTWYFAEGAGGTDFNTWILLLNPNADPAQVTVSFLQEKGQSQTVSYRVPPTSRMNVWVNKIVSGGAVATKIQADRPIVAERSMYWANGRAGHNTLGAPAPANQWFLPEGSTGGFNEWILLMNPGGNAANVTLTFVDERGQSVAKSYQVPSSSRLNVFVNQIVSGSAISTLVQSDQAIVVERSSYTADNLGGTNSMGIPR